MYTFEERFPKWACERLTEDADFSTKIIFSDEAHFDLGGNVNNQNCRIWAQKIRTHTLESRHTQNESMFGFWFRGIIEPFYFENEQ